MESTALPASIAFLVVLVAFCAAVVVYFLPFVVGDARHVPHLGSIFVVNLLLGWTLIGWVAAMAMACRSKAPPVTAIALEPSAGLVSRSFECSVMLVGRVKGGTDAERLTQSTPVASGESDC